MCTREKGYDCEHQAGDPTVWSDVAWLANGVGVYPNFQPTIQPTKSDVLYDLRVLRQSPRTCKLLKIDTVEVRSSSLLVPTISFNHLVSLTSLPEASNGSIKDAEPGRGGGGGGLGGIRRELRRNPAPDGSRRVSPFLRSRDTDFPSNDTNVDRAWRRKLGVGGCRGVCRY
jgi:hypothetical protein